MKSKGNRTKFEFVESSSYPSSSYSDSTVLTIYARAAITSPEKKEKQFYFTTEKRELSAI